MDNACENFCDACKNGDFHKVKVLVQSRINDQCFKDYAIQCSSAYGHLEIVQFLANNGANIHIYNDLPICLASDCGHLGVVRYLAKNGSNIPDQAIRWASEKGYTEIVNFLKSFGKLPIDFSKYPHICTICGSPAYISGSNSIDCSSCKGVY